VDECERQDANKYCAYHHAATTDAVEVIHRMVQICGVLWQSAPGGVGVLAIAAQHGAMRVAQYLLEHRVSGSFLHATTDGTGHLDQESPLYRAVASNYPGMVELLLAHGFPWGGTHKTRRELFTLIIDRNLERCLASIGRAVDSTPEYANALQSVVAHAAQCGRVVIIRHMIVRGLDMTPAIAGAITGRSLGVIKLILPYVDVPPHRRGDVMLLAVAGGATDIVRMFGDLLFPTATPDDPQMWLQCAVDNGHAMTAQQLMVSYGGSLDLCNTSIAYRYQRYPFINWLVSQGVPVSPMIRPDVTPYEAALIVCNSPLLGRLGAPPPPGPNTTFGSWARGALHLAIARHDIGVVRACLAYAEAVGQGSLGDMSTTLGRALTAYRAASDYSTNRILRRDARGIIGLILHHEGRRRYDPSWALIDPLTAPIGNRAHRVWISLFDQADPEILYLFQEHGVEFLGMPYKLSDVGSTRDPRPFIELLDRFGAVHLDFPVAKDRAIANAILNRASPEIVRFLMERPGAALAAQPGMWDRAAVGSAAMLGDAETASMLIANGYLAPIDLLPPGPPGDHL
jgi:hypothetical protein